MSRAAKLKSMMSAAGYSFDKLMLVAPSTHPLAGCLSDIRGFPRADTFWSDLQAIRSECDRIISMHELRGVVDLVRTEVGSDLWFAVHVSDLCGSLLDRRDSGQQALSQADLEDCIALGSAVTRWEWRTNYGDDIKTGRPVGRGASLGGQMASAAFADSRKTILDFIASRFAANSKMTVTRAAREAYEAGLGTSPDANRKLWENHQPK